MKYYAFEYKGAMFHKIAQSAKPLVAYFRLGWSLLLSGRAAETKAPLLFANDQLHEIAVALSFASTRLAFRVVQKWTGYA